MRFIFLFTVLVFISCDRKIPGEKLPTVSFERGEFLNRTIADLTSQLDNESSKQDLVRLGNYLGQNGWATEAVKWSEIAIGPHRESVELSTQLGQYYFAIGEFQWAQEYSATANQLGAQSVEFYQLQAELSTYSQEYEQALDYVNRAILINQSDYYLYQTKANIYLTIGDTVSGIEFLKRGLELQPRLEDIAARLTQLYLDQGQNDKALDLIRQMQQHNPDNEELYWQEAQYYLAYDSIQRAKLILLSAIGEDSIRYQLKEKLADLYLELGKLDSALMLSESLLLSDSMLIHEHIRVGDIYDRKNFLGRSLVAYRKALSIDSTSDIALQGQTKVLRKLAYLRELKEAREQLPSFDILTPKKN